MMDSLKRVVLGAVSHFLLRARSYASFSSEEALRMWARPWGFGDLPHDEDFWMECRREFSLATKGQLEKAMNIPGMNTEDLDLQLRILRPRPGDVLVVYASSELTDGQRAQIRTALEKALEGVAKGQAQGLFILVLETHASAVLMTKEKAKEMLQRLAAKG